MIVNIQKEDPRLGQRLTADELDELTARYETVTASFGAMREAAAGREPVTGVDAMFRPLEPPSEHPRDPLEDPEGPRQGSLEQARDALGRGEISSEELVADHLARARSIAPLRSFVTISDERALREARAADAARSRGESLGPLHGIPVSAKDIVSSEGVRTTSGSILRPDWVPERDAPCLAALKRAGAVLIGKTNLHELAFGVTSINPHYGAVENPWTRATPSISGGSSGGSAASVAAGVGLASLGTDTAGSIRIPAALCGVVGLKPTYGAVSRDGVTPLSWSLDHIGPIARTVADVALVFDVLSGASTYRRLRASPKGLTFAVHDRYFFDDLAPEVEAAVRSALEALSGLGLERVAMDVPELEWQSACRSAIAFSEAAAYHSADLRSRPHDFGTDTLELLRTGLLLSASDYVDARRARGAVVEAFYRGFEGVDILATPATVAAACSLESSTLDNGEDIRAGLLRMTSPFNTVGFPAVSVPCGFTEDGRPIGLQLVAKPGGEAVLLQVAHAYERSQTFRDRAPVI